MQLLWLTSGVQMQQSCVSTLLFVGHFLVHVFFILLIFLYICLFEIAYVESWQSPGWEIFHPMGVE